MRKALVILFLFNSCYLFCQNTSIGYKSQYDSVTGNGMNIPHGIFNVIIGYGAGKYLTTESYCVIVGHDSIAVNTKGKDMVWYVNWDEPLLIMHPDIKKILFDYYLEYIKTGKDDKHYRSGMILRVINRNNKLIGVNATINNNK